MEQIKMLYATLDGKQIGYSSATEFLVQVGKGKRGAYETKYRFVGDLAQAISHYKSIKLSNGVKKRLLMPSCAKKPIMAREFWS